MCLNLFAHSAKIQIKDWQGAQLPNRKPKQKLSDCVNTIVKCNSLIYNFKKIIFIFFTINDTKNKLYYFSKK
jgi:hypothetical protein